jgi:hypothetical protein
MLKDAMSLPVLKKAVDSLKRMRNGLSRLLLLDVDLLKTLGRPDPKKYGTRSLNSFLRDPPSKQVHDKDFYLCVIRRLCIFLVEWPFFNNLILVLILVNGVLVAMVDPLESYSTVASSQRHIDLSNTLVALNILFVLELLITFIAHGVYFAGPNSHLRNNWNKCDALIVMMGLLDFIPSLNELSPLRTLKILRPLRTITRFPVLRDMIVLVLKIVPTLFHIFYLLMILLIVLAVIAVQLWAGISRRRCFHQDSGLRLGHTPRGYGLERTCTLQDSLSPGLFRCPPSYACVPQVCVCASVWVCAVYACVCCLCMSVHWLQQSVHGASESIARAEAQH